MGKSSPQTHAKRQRELAKKERRKAKQERRVLRKEQKAQNDDSSVPHGQDPDLYGIVPGPQPPPE